MIKKLVLIVFVVSGVFILQARAQTATPISPEKLALIKDIIALVNADNKAEQMVEIFDRQMSGTRLAMIDSILKERADLTEAERKSLRDALAAKQEDLSKRFREKLLQKLNYNEMINEISIIVYDKYYTTDELKDLLAFYKTPTGQKLLKTMTPLMSDTMQLTQERLLTKLPLVLEELQHEEKTVLEEELNTRQPPKKKASFN